MQLVTNPAVRAILLYLEPGHPKLASVVAGMREAAGKAARLVLCCVPALEPVARKIATQGADDYLIDPPQGREVDRALRLAPTEPFHPADVPQAEEHLEEIEDIGTLLTAMELGPRRILDRLANLIRRTFDAGGATISLENMLATSGQAVENPVLVDLIQHQAATVGQIALGPRKDRPYTAGDAEKLSYYARLVGRIVETTRRQNVWRTLALTDDLTGLPNRRYLFQRLDSLLDRARQDRSRLTVLLFDIDDFKKYNDTYGHQVGDEIIRDTAQLFRKHCRKDDVVTRYGGDEFVVVFWDADQPRVAGSRHPTTALEVLERFKTSLRSHKFKSLGPAANGLLTISGGLATFPWDGGDAQNLLRKADDALRQAKESGKNQILLVGSGRMSAPVLGQDAQTHQTPSPSSS